MAHRKQKPKPGFEYQAAVVSKIPCGAKKNTVLQAVRSVIETPCIDRVVICHEGKLTVLADCPDRESKQSFQSRTDKLVGFLRTV